MPEILGSSMISSYEYDEQTQQLTVYFTKGRVYAYEGVPPDVAAGLGSAPSAGTYLNTTIKGAYPYSRVA